jgi:serine phosphatase RsbU (regulator of sigma subunit)
MAQLRAVLRAYALTERDPATVLTRLDNYVQHSHPMGLATVVYAVLDTEDGSLTVAVAGHPPLLLAGDGTAALLDVRGGPPIGAVPFPHYVAHTVHLARGDTAVLYTDGLVERRGESIDDGIDRLRQIAAHAPAEPELLADHILRALLPGAGGEDDIALLAVQPAPVPASTG